MWRIPQNKDKNMPKNIDLKLSVNESVKIDFTNKSATAYGGFALLAKFFKKIQLQDHIENAIPFTEISPNSTGVFAKVIRFGLTIAAGGTRFSHSMFLGDSLNIYEAEFEIERIPKSISAVTRFFEKFESQKLVELFSEKLWQYLFNIILPLVKSDEDYLTFDSTVITRYGEQEGADKGYNSKKKGRPSHHPIIAFLNRSRFIANFWNRCGSSSSGNGIIDFANQTFERLNGLIKITKVLADSGFYKEAFLKFLEGKSVEYIVTAIFYGPVQRMVIEVNNWITVDDGIEVGEFQFKHKDWQKERRYIVIRKLVKIEGAPPQGKQLSLFPEDEVFVKYRFGVYITSSSSDAVELWRTYRLRASDEGLIRELKESFSLEGFCQNGFYPTEAAMLMRVLFYNLMECFMKKFAIGEEKQTFKTFRMKYLLIPSVLGRDGKELIVRMAVKTEKLKSKITSMIRLMDELKINCIAFENPTSLPS